MRTLYRNGVVHARAVGPVHALLVADGRIAWLGSDGEVDRLGAIDDVVDVGGALITPGLVDAHVHVLETGFALTGVDLSAAGSLAAALDKVARAARLGAQPLLGHGWDETRWPGARPPTRNELDRATDGGVAYVSRVDLHSAVVSSALAALARCTELPGWRDDGLVTGDAHRRAREAARDVASDRRESLCRTALTAAAARGVVSLHEHSAPCLDTREGLARLLAMTRQPASALAGVVGYRGELCETVDDARRLLDAVPGLTGIGGDLTVDGSLGSRTAALRQPYGDDPGSRGTLELSAEQVANHVASVTRAGVHAAFHVIGDRAMEEVLLGFQAAGDVEGIDGLRAAGHRLEHAEMVDTAALARILLFGLVVSAQPAFDAAWGGPAGMYAQRLGRVRAIDLNPFADLSDSGVPLAFGSDSPVTPIDPWSAVRAAVQHHEPGQRLPLDVAFRAHTVGGWRAAHGRHTGAGELRVGAPASLAIWQVAGLADRDPAGTRWRGQLPPLPLPDLSPGTPSPVCLRTVRDGVVVHDVLG